MPFGFLLPYKLSMCGMEMFSGNLKPKPVAFAFWHVSVLPQVVAILIPREFDRLGLW